jgi:threonine dehydratase
VTASRRIPGIGDAHEAARRLAGHVVRTPLVHSPYLSERTGADVWLKVEALQITGSFKFRGALNAVLRLRQQRPDLSAILTASAGNHGLALATAASRAGLRTRIYLPATAPHAKRARLASLGAEVLDRPSYDDAENDAREEAARTGATFVSPYDDEDVIAGAGTVGLEMLEDRSELDTIVVPVGGGGLIAGIGVAARSHRASVAVHGAEAGASPVFTSALAAGRPVIVEVRETLADGLAGNMDPASRTFGMVQTLVASVTAVDEAAIAAAMSSLVYRDRLVVEGAGAVGVAAILNGLDVRGRRVGVVLSGRNVDEARLRTVLGAAGAA